MIKIFLLNFFSYLNHFALANIRIKIIVLITKISRQMMKLNFYQVKMLFLTRNLYKVNKFSKFYIFSPTLVRMTSTEVKKMKISPNTIGTHSGTFHCDEILAGKLNKIRFLKNFKKFNIISII